MGDDAFCSFGFGKVSRPLVLGRTRVSRSRRSAALKESKFFLYRVRQRNASQEMERNRSPFEFARAVLTGVLESMCEKEAGSEVPNNGMHCRGCVKTTVS